MNSWYCRPVCILSAAVMEATLFMHGLPLLPVLEKKVARENKQHANGRSNILFSSDTARSGESIAGIVVVCCSV